MSGNTKSGRVEKEKKFKDIPPVSEEWNMEPPKFFDEVELEFWLFTVPLLVERGSLTNCDFKSFCRLCSNYRDYVEADEFLRKNGQMYESKTDRGDHIRWFEYPHCKNKERAQKAIEHLEKKFGLTPLDRDDIPKPVKAKSSVRSKYKKTG